MNDSIDDKRDTGGSGTARSARAEEKARRIEEMRAAKAAKEAAKEAAKAQAKAEALAAKNAAKASKKAKEPKAAKAAKADKEPKEPKATKPAKESKDPYRPRFAVAPTPVRVFTVLAWLMAVVSVAAAALVALIAADSLEFDLPVEVDSTLLYALAGLSAVAAVLWVVAAVKVPTGFRSGVVCGTAAVVCSVISPTLVALPLLMAAAVALLARDTRDWAIDVKD